MENIKFINRAEELKKLKEVENSNFFLVLKGRRRIGKTRLLRRAFPNASYIFIWPDKSIDWIIEQVCREQKIPLFKKFIDILEYLLNNKKMIVIDEFQNFLNVDKSIYGEIQKVIDERKINKKFLKIAIAGSSYSLMNKVFNDSASPLYGRRTEEMALENLPINDLFKGFRYSIEDFIKIWSVFEGIPYYYELINFNLLPEKNIKKLILSKEAQLQEEGKVLLSVEFGKDSKTYNTVLTAIAEGKNKLNEIATLFSNKKNEVIKYLDILRKEFRFVRKITPITDNPRKSREGRYEIIDNFLSFWFYFVDRYRNYIEQERFAELEENFNTNFNSFVGRKFEKFILNLIKNKTLLNNFSFSSIGKQWGKIPNTPKDKNQYEIDIVALNETTKEILFAECKWKDKVNAKKIFTELKEKAKHVNWNNEKRKESYAIFAKSFLKKIKEFEGQKVYCYDLKNLSAILK